MESYFFEDQSNSYFTAGEIVQLLTVFIKENVRTDLYVTSKAQFSTGGVYFGIDSKTWVIVSMRIGPLVTVVERDLR